MRLWPARFSTIHRMILATTGVLGVVCCAGAQTAHFSGAQSTVISDPAGPMDTAVDQYGNVFVVDFTGGSVYEIQAVNGEIPSTPQTTPIISGLKNPRGIAVDRAGNVYVADTGDGVVLELNPVQGTKATLTINIVAPSALAVDASGDVFVADQFTGNIYEIVAVNGAIPTNPTIVTVAGGFVSPSGLAIDSKGNLYVAGSNQPSIQEILAVNGAIPTNPTVVSVGTSLSGACGVAADEDGNLYVTLSGGSAVVFKLMAVDGVVAASPVEIAYGSGLSSACGLSAGGNGRVFVADLGNSRIEEVETGRVNFPSGNVGSPQPPVTLTFSFDIGGKLASAPSVLTQGESGLDFTDAGTGTCTTNGTGHTYASGDTCTVDVKFTPIRPGTRTGVAVLGGSEYFNFAHAFLEGFGVGPQVSYLPAIQKTLGSGFQLPQSVAVDARGNVYVADSSNGAVKELVAVGGVIPSSPVINTIGNGFLFPLAVAVDGGGNLYVSDGATGGVYEIYAVNGTIPSAPVVRILGAFGYPQGLAVDSSGDVYVADSGTDTGGIYKIVADDGNLDVSERASIETVLEGTIPPFYLPVSVAVDSEGNLFFVDAYHVAIDEIPSKGGIVAAPPVVFTAVSGTSLTPAGVALDEVGNLYFSNSSDNTVYEEPAPISPFQVLRTVGSGLAQPRGLAVDRKGNVFIANSGSSTSAVIEEDFANAPALQFATTSVGMTSADSPKTVTIENSGNATLTLAQPGTGFNPAYPAAFPANSKDSNLCAAGMVLQPETGCDISANFVPSAPGPVSGKIQILDNNLNVANNTQTIPVSGAGALLPQTIKFTLTGTPTYGALPITMAAVSSSGLPVDFAVVSGPGKVAGPELTITGAGPITVSASQAGNATYLAAAPVQQTITVLPAALKVTINSISRAYGAANPAFTSAVEGLLNNDAVTVVYNTTATASSPVGTYPITALLSGTRSINYNPTFVPGKLTVVKAALQIVWPSPAPIAQGTALSATQLDASANAAGAMVYSPATGTVLSLGQHTLSVKFTPTDTVDYSSISAQTAISVLQSTATPTFSVPGGTYTTVQSVKLLDTTAGASIYYTLDGTAPTLNSAVYSMPISVGSTETIRAMAFAAGDAQSAADSATYTIHLPAAATPMLSPAGGTYTSEPSVTISDATSGATIYYTTNGTFPNVNCAVYSKPIVVGTSETIRAIAVAPNHSNSPAANVQYTLNLPATTSPVFSPKAGTYEAAQSVTISDTMSGAAIYFTTDGTKPSLNSTRYTAPIAVSTGQTISAIAAAPGHQGSAVVTAKYTIGSAVKSIAITPAPPALPSGATLQLKATATYADGTTKDVTNSVTWSTSAASTASATSTGVLVGNSSGVTTATASLNGVTGSTPLVVTLPANSRPVATVYGNPTDSHALTAMLSDGTQLDYFGPKDSNGIVQSISSVVLTRSNGAATVATYNSDGLPVSIHGSGGGSISVQWTSSTGGYATAVTPDGTRVGPVPFNVPSESASTSLMKARSLLRNFQKAKPQQLISNTSTSIPPPVVSVQVTECGGRPVENADVTLFMTSSDQKTRPIQMTSEPQPGLYNFWVPVPAPEPPGLNVLSDCRGFGLAADGLCHVTVGALAVASVAVAATEIFSAAILAAAISETAAEFGLVTVLTAETEEVTGSAILAEAEEGIDTVCELLSPATMIMDKSCDMAAELTDEANSLGPQITLTATAALSGLPVSAPPQVVSAQNPSTTFTVDLDQGGDNPDCKILSVAVTPKPASVQVGSTIPLTAQAYDAGFAPVSGTYTWSSGDTTIATVDPSTGVVTGVAGGSTTVTATETSSGVQGDTTVTVSSVAADRFLYLFFGVTGDLGAYAPASGTVTINGVTIAATNALEFSGGLYKICNVPDNTSFTLDVSTNTNFQIYPDGLPLGAANLMPAETFITSNTQSFGMQASMCAASNTCDTAADLEGVLGPVLNSCVSIPGVNQ